MNIRLDLEKTRNEKIQMKTGFTVLKYEAQSNKTQREILMNAIGHLGQSKLASDKEVSEKKRCEELISKSKLERDDL